MHARTHTDTHARTHTHTLTHTHTHMRTRARTHTPSSSSITTRKQMISANYIKDSKEGLFIMTLKHIETQSANVRGNPLRQATKRHLNNSKTVKNGEKWDDLSSVWFGCCFLVQCLERDNCMRLKIFLRSQIYNSSIVYHFKQCTRAEGWVGRDEGRRTRGGGGGWWVDIGREISFN